MLLFELCDGASASLILLKEGKLSRSAVTDDSSLAEITTTLEYIKTTKSLLFILLSYVFILSQIFQNAQSQRNT